MVNIKDQVVVNGLLIFGDCDPLSVHQTTCAFVILKTRSINGHALVEEKEFPLWIDVAMGTKPVRFISNIVARTNIGNSIYYCRCHIFYLESNRVHAAIFMNFHHVIIATFHFLPLSIRNQQGILLNRT